MKLTFDPEADAAYVHLVDLDEGEQVATTKVCDVFLDRAAVNLDFDRAGKLLGIELLGVSRLLRSETIADASR